MVQKSKIFWNRVRQTRAADAVCEPGYQRNWWGNCVDVDECANAATNECNGLKCVNTAGSYTCIEQTTPHSSDIRSCEEGYARNWWGKCTDVDECQQPGICATDRCENTDGSYRCIQEQQTLQKCNPGYFYNKVTEKCEDIDECLIELDNCIESICENTLGSFRCIKQKCFPGFEHATGGCVDIDECLRLEDSACSIDETCQNSKGSFFCQKCVRMANELHCYQRRQCMPGYEPSRLTLFPCIDVDECKSGFHECTEAEECINTVPGYRCNCRRGYTRNLKGECSDKYRDCGVSNVCPDTSHPNPCPTGFKLADDGLKCIDINECLEDNICDTHSECHNYKGGYRCYIKTQ